MNYVSFCFSATEIMKKYDVLKPIHFFKNIQVNIVKVTLSC